MIARYALLDGDTVVNVTLWDGDTKRWQPPAELSAVLVSDEIAVGWTFDGKEWAKPVPPPAPVPEQITDWQFFWQLANLGVITEDDALAAVKTGTLPPALDALVEMLPKEEQFSARMLLCGSVNFRFDHPLVPTLAGAFGWDKEQSADFFRAADRLL